MRFGFNRRLMGIATAGTLIFNSSVWAKEADSDSKSPKKVVIKKLEPLIDNSEIMVGNNKKLYQSNAIDFSKVISDVKHVSAEAELYNFIKNDKLDEKAFIKKWGYLSIKSDKEIVSKYLKRGQPLIALKLLVLKKALFMLKSGAKNKYIISVVRSFDRRIFLYRKELLKGNVTTMTAEQYLGYQSKIFERVDLTKMIGYAPLLNSLALANDWDKYMAKVIVAQGFSEILGYPGDGDKSYVLFNSVLSSFGLDFVESWPATWDSLVSMGLDQKTSDAVRDMGEKKVYHKGYANQMYLSLLKHGAIRRVDYFPTSVIYVHKGNNFLTAAMSYLYFLYRLDKMYGSLKSKESERDYIYLIKNVNLPSIKRDLAVYMALANYMTGYAPKIFRLYIRCIRKGKAKPGSFDRWIGLKQSYVRRKVHIKKDYLSKLVSYAKRYVYFYDYLTKKIVNVPKKWDTNLSFSKPSL